MQVRNLVFAAILQISHAYQGHVESSSCAYVTTNLKSVGFVVLTVIAMKSYVFYNIMPYNPVKVG
jgi:hypothetical protein